MGLEELSGMSPGAKGHGRLGGCADGLDPEILDELPEPLHGIARVGLVEMQILHEPLDAVAHKLLGEIHGCVVAARLEEEGASGLVGKVRLFIQIHAVTLLKFGVFFTEAWDLSGTDPGVVFLFTSAVMDFFCSFKKREIAQVI